MPRLAGRPDRDLQLANTKRPGSDFRCIADQKSTRHRVATLPQMSLPHNVDLHTDWPPIESWRLTVVPRNRKQSLHHEFPAPISMLHNLAMGSSCTG